MTLSQIDAIISNITYKPGYEVTVLQHMSYDSVMFAFKAQVRDVNDKEKWIPLVHQMHIMKDHLRTSEELIRYIKMGWKQFESHEFDEWFRIGGIPLVIPHPELDKR